MARLGQEDLAVIWFIQAHLLLLLIRAAIQIVCAVAVAVVSAQMVRDHKPLEVEVVAEAMRLAALTPVVPQGYRLRTLTMNDLEPFAQANGFETVGEADADVVLAMVSPVQLHLAINVPGGFVHAHAGIGRVTFLPGVLPWPVACSWRVPITMPTIRN